MGRKFGHFKTLNILDYNRVGLRMADQVLSGVLGC